MKGEAAFIDALRMLATHPAARGLMDDAAVLEVGGEALVLTHDMMVEGVHFLPEQDPADVAWKLVARNLSDLAAKGAEPVGVLLGFMLGEGEERFVEGLTDVLGHYGVPLLGGDTSSGGPPRAHGLTAIGRAVHRPVPSRAGARMGDALWLTGSLGAAMMGFEALRDGTGGDSEAYRRPWARVAEGKALAPVVTAMMDVSDGLLLDAWRMAEASGVSLAIESAAVPVAAPEDRRLDALRWGDDYELLFTLPTGVESTVPAARIGGVEPMGFVPLFLDGEPIANSEGLGWEHKASRSSPVRGGGSPQG
jgi:thiamine-monophosphate kinase